MAPEARRPTRSMFGGAVVGAGNPWAAAWIAVALLVGVGVEGGVRGRAPDATEYHLKVKRSAKDNIPLCVGEWLGTEVKPEPSAIELLHPNVISQMRYANVRTGETANLLFVQCRDARDIVGHYPPICYVAHGMTLAATSAHDWQVGDHRITGTRYRFVGKAMAATSELVVDNFMVLPTGVIGRDMDSVNQVAKDRRMRGFGAAQVQVLTTGAMGDGRRDEIFDELVGRILPLLDCVEFKTENQRD